MLEKEKSSAWRETNREHSHWMQRPQHFHEIIDLYCYYHPQ